MSRIDHTFFKEKLSYFLGRRVDAISTIDHPYASPPVRLIDGHHRVQSLFERAGHPLICIWDVNAPDVRSYRYELCFDTGLLSGRDRSRLIFTDHASYPLQKPQSIDFLEQRERFRFVLGQLHDRTGQYRICRENLFLKNFDVLAAVYEETTKNASNGTDFYQKLLQRFYVLLGFDDLAAFVRDSFYPFFGSPIMQRWIPYCIQETREEPFGFANLLKAGLFKKPYFRTMLLPRGTPGEFLDKEYVLRNLDEILSDMAKNVLVPTYEILFWTLFLSDIPHFGNDYGFFDRLKKTLDHLNVLHSDRQIQLTQHKEDSQFIVKFEKDRSFSYFVRDNHRTARRNNSLKSSKISSLPALYLHLGRDLGPLIKNIFRKEVESPQIIKMGEASHCI